MISVLVHGNMKQTHCVALVEAQKTHNDVKYMSETVQTK